MGDRPIIFAENVNFVIPSRYLVFIADKCSKATMFYEFHKNIHFYGVGNSIIEGDLIELFCYYFTNTINFF